MLLMCVYIFLLCIFQSDEESFEGIRAHSTLILASEKEKFFRSTWIDVKTLVEERERDLYYTSLNM